MVEMLVSLIRHVEEILGFSRQKMELCRSLKESGWYKKWRDWQLICYTEATLVLKIQDTKMTHLSTRNTKHEPFGC